MSALLKTLFDICLLRKGPEDLPANNSLMLMLVACSVLVSLYLGSFIHDYQIAFILSVVGVVIAFAFSKLLLIKKPERFLQTYSAMLGATILIDIITVPIVLPLLNEDLNKSLIVMFSLLLLATYVWYVVVNGFIVSRAISSTLGYGVSISIAYVLVAYMIFKLILTANLAG